MCHLPSSLMSRHVVEVALTHSTFFWGGETFAPSLKVGPKGINIQTYLQDAFLGMWGKVLDAVCDLDTVLGFEVGRTVAALALELTADSQRAPWRIHRPSDY